MRLKYNTFLGTSSDKLHSKYCTVSLVNYTKPISEYWHCHMDNEGATLVSTINLGLYGVILCLPFLITGRLGMSTGMHFSWNLVQGVFFGFAVSGNSTEVSIISVDMSNNALTGGFFEPEGSVLFLFICVIAVALLLL